MLGLQHLRTTWRRHHHQHINSHPSHRTHQWRYRHHRRILAYMRFAFKWCSEMLGLQQFRTNRRRHHHQHINSHTSHRTHQWHHRHHRRWIPNMRVVGLWGVEMLGLQHLRSGRRWHHHQHINSHTSHRAHQWHHRHHRRSRSYVCAVELRSGEMLGKQRLRLNWRQHHHQQINSHTSRRTY